MNIQTLGGLHGIVQLKSQLAAPNTNGAVITERNIFIPLHLFIMTSAINKAEASGNGNRLFIEKAHVQI
jgi:hypothetical protein